MYVIHKGEIANCLMTDSTKTTIENSTSKKIMGVYIFEGDTHIV